MTMTMTMTMTVGNATGGLFDLESEDIRPLIAALVRENAYAMPYHSPSYGRPAKLVSGSSDCCAV
jgi:hypothetical protein